MKVTLLNLTENPVEAIENAASVCYDSIPTGGAIMRHCYKSGHRSVLEFADFTFKIEGVSRALLAQITRHRISSFAVRSQRYCDEDGFVYVIPPSIADNEDALLIFTQCMDTCSNTYEKLKDFGVPNEDARFVLPNACATTIVFKCNGRQLINSSNERLCKRAQWEIRECFKKMKKCVSEYNEQCKEFSKMLVPKCYINPDMPFCTETCECDIAPKLRDVYNVYKNDLKNKEVESFNNKV